jgi:hypothetical protein
LKIPKVIRSLKSKKYRQYNGEMKNNKRTNNDLQNITQKTKDRVTRTPLKTNNDLQNIAQKTKDRVTPTPLKTQGEFQKD